MDDDELETFTVVLLLPFWTVLETEPLVDTGMSWPLMLTWVLLPLGGGSVPLAETSGVLLESLGSGAALPLAVLGVPGDDSEPAPLVPLAWLLAIIMAIINKNAPAKIRLTRFRVKLEPGWPEVPTSGCCD